MIHLQLIVAGLFTGAFIGFFWHPVAAVLALLLATVISRGSGPQAADPRR